MCHKFVWAKLEETPYESIMRRLAPSYEAAVKGMALPLGFAEQEGENEVSRRRRLLDGTCLKIP